jgi:hypothetical protein
MNLCNGNGLQNLSAKCPNGFSCVTGSAMSGGMQTMILGNN